MKIALTKDDVMAIVCSHLNRPYISETGGTILPTYDQIYWEGNPEKKKED